MLITLEPLGIFSSNYASRDYSLHLRVVQYCLDFKHMLYRVESIGEQSVLVRTVPELIVGKAGAGGGLVRQGLAPVLLTSGQTMLK